MSGFCEVQWHRIEQWRMKKLQTKNAFKNFMINKIRTPPDFIFLSFV